MGHACLLVAALVTGEPEVPSATPDTPAAWELHWQAPDACPDAEAIREQVAALVPGPTGGQGVLDVVAEVTRSEGEFVLNLRTSFFDRHDAREVRAPACDELAEAVVLVVAISLDPSLDPSSAVPPAPSRAAGDSAVTAPHEATREPVLAPATEPAAPRSGTPADRGLPARRARRSPAAPEAWFARLGPQLEIGSLPPFGGGLDLAVGLLWRWVRLEIHGAYLWPRRAGGPRGSGGVFQLGAVGARGCARPRVGRVELPVCLGLDAGALRVDSVNLDPARTVHGPWLAPNVGAGVAIAGARVGFFTLVEASVAAVRPRIFVGDEAIFRSSVVSGRWLAGLELYFAIKTP